MLAALMQPVALGCHRFAIAYLNFQVRLQAVLAFSYICALPLLMPLSRMQGHEADLVRRQAVNGSIACVLLITL